MEIMSYFSMRLEHYSSGILVLFRIDVKYGQYLNTDTDGLAYNERA